MTRDRAEIVKYLNKLEQRGLCMNDKSKINNWFKNVTKQDNSIVMQVTEKAKTATYTKIMKHSETNQKKFVMFQN